MENLVILESDYTPEIIIDATNYTAEFKGNSIPEDAAKLFEPVIKWFDTFENNPDKTFIFNFKFTYFNTKSAEYILAILMKIRDFYDKKFNVKIIWHYEKNDEDMKDAGIEFSHLCELPFEFLEY